MTCPLFTQGLWQELLVQRSCVGKLRIFCYYHLGDCILSDVVNELNMKDFVVAYGMTETSPVTFQVGRKVFLTR